MSATTTLTAVRSAKSVITSLRSLVCGRLQWTDAELVDCGFTTDLHLTLNSIIDRMASAANADPRFVGGDTFQTVLILSALLTRWSWTRSELVAAGLNAEIVNDVAEVVVRMRRVCRRGGVSLTH
jgi:hypothetical protein